MANFEDARVKSTNRELNRLESIAKYKTVTTLRITKEHFQDEELPPELFLTVRQKIEIRNVLAKNMSLDIKLVKLSRLE